MGGLSI